MNWIIITCMSVFFILGALFYLSNPDNDAETVLGKLWEAICCVFVSACFGIIFGGLLGGFICLIGRGSLETEEKVVKNYELIALDTNEDTHGSYSSVFFVGSGYIGEEMYYHFYYDTPQGIKYKKVRAENCYIIESNEKPSYKIYGEFLKKTKSVFYRPYLEREAREVLYIPKGTIKSNYKIN